MKLIWQMEQALNDFPLWGRLDSFLYVMWASAKMSCTCQELLLYQIALSDDYLKIFNFRRAYLSFSEYVGVKPMFKQHQLCGKYGDVGAAWTFFLCHRHSSHLRMSCVYGVYQAVSACQALSWTWGTHWWAMPRPHPVYSVLREET